MTTIENSTLAELLAAAAVSAAATLASGEALAPGEAILGSETDLGELEAVGTAVLVQFTGPLTGELVLVIDAELGVALANSPLGSLDLAAALAPAVEAVGAAIGPVVLGAVQQTEARLAVRRALNHPEAGLVTLVGAAGVRAAVVLGVDSEEGGAGSAQPQTQAAAAASAIAAQHGASNGFVPSADRLDLLRGVEMQATAELGRVRMTVNDLLALRDGAVIELDRAAGAPADLFVNGRLIARGEVVVVDENYGLRITQVITDADAR